MGTSHEMVTFDSRIMEALEALRRGATTIWDTSPTGKGEKTPGHLHVQVPESLSGAAVEV